MALSLFSLACAAAVACWDDQQAPTGPRLELSVQRDTGLAAVADTWIEQDVPNANHGTSTILRVRLTGKNRALLRWDQQSLQQVVGMDSLVSATLEITYSTPAFYWEQGTKALFLHRVTQAWTESGATWNCAIDEFPTDGLTQCGGPTAWNMTSAPPIVTPATASFLVQNGSSGTVQLNVTGDVRAWLAGTATNHGWLLKKELENISGLAEFGSRESGTPPRLVLTILSADTSVPPIPTGPISFTYDTTKLVLNGGTNVYQRDVFTVAFRQGTPGLTIRSFFTRFGAVVIGGAPRTGGYMLRIPDPGTTAAWDSIGRAMASDTNVSYAVPLMYRLGGIQINGRWPIDGSQVQRAHWFSAAQTNGTRALTQGRFPLAWGCETGDYGSNPVDVAVLDYYFRDHADMGGGVGGVVVSRTFPGGRTLPKPAALDSLHTPTAQGHGLAVSSIVGARTDNGAGITGAAWNVRLRQYALAIGDSTFAHPQYLSDTAIAGAGIDGARILVIAADFPEDTLWQFDQFVNLVLRGMKGFLAADARNLIVIAAGNDGQRRPVADFAQGLTPRKYVVRGAAARLFHRGDPDTSRVIFVNAGNRDLDALWSGSNDMLGASAIVSPGEDVHTLWLNEGEASFTGTSVAAPLVAGAAALAMAFDPTRTGAAIKRLLLDTLSVNSSDSLVARTRIANRVILDAYTPLFIEARDNVQSPICGFPVSIRDDLRAVILEPRGVAPRTVSVPLGPNEYITSLSVAQGGRRIATHAYDFVQDSRRSIVTTHSGSFLDSVAGTRRVYLERDTADITGGASGDSVLRVFGVSDPTPRIFPLLASLDTSFANFYEGQFEIFGVEPSPDGNYAVVALHWWFGCDPVQFFNQFVERERIFLFPLTSGTPQVLSQSVRACPFFGVAPTEHYVTFQGGASWSHTGSVGVLFANGTVNNNYNAFVWESSLMSFRPPSPTATSTATVSGLVLDVAYGSDDSLIVALEATDFGGVGCRRQARRSEAVGTTVGTAVTLSEEQCAAARFLHIPNAPTRAGRGFQLFANPNLGPGRRVAPPAAVRVN